MFIIKIELEVEQLRRINECLFSDDKSFVLVCLSLAANFITGFIISRPIDTAPYGSPLSKVV
jgi:hypothetical protein